MSALSPQQINQSYQGLLKLSDSTTGITSTLQAVEDGLGNDTGLNIATNRLEGGNIFNLYKPGIAQYYGAGFTANASTPGAVQNTLVVQGFYDNGLYSYSAITVNVITLEAGTSVDVAFYNSQYLDTYGYAPYQKLTTEVNINTASTGIKTVSFSSPLSFSGTGPGFYFVVFRFNTAATPVLRLAGSALSNNAQYWNGILLGQVGVTFNTAGTQATCPNRVNSTSSFTQIVNYNTASFPSTWTSTELNTITSTAPSAQGFLLNTSR